jgi:hypothetical protein
MDDVRDRLRRASEIVAPFERPFDRMIERRDRKRRSQRLASAAVAFVIAAAAVGGGVLLLSRLGRDPHDAVGTGWQPTRSLALRPGEYFYLKVESSEEEDGWIRDEETWWGLDGSGEVRNRGTRQDKYPYPPTGSYAAGEFPVQIPNVGSLSTDAQTLSAQLRDEPWTGLNGSEADPLWDSVVPLLLETPYATPELRAALFEIAGGIDGVTVTKNDRDPVGRAAIGLRVSEEENGATWMMYFDPGTHQALAWTFRSDRGGESWEILESGIVDEIGSRPEGGQWLVPPTADGPS